MGGGTDRPRNSRRVHRIPEERSAGFAETPEPNLATGENHSAGIGVTSTFAGGRTALTSTVLSDPSDRRTGRPPSRV